MTFDQGPFLLAAVTCERVLNEADGVQSIIRIIDRITHTPVVETPNAPMAPFDYPLTLFILLKAGIASGSYTLRVTVVNPSGDSPQPFQQSVYFEGDEDRGVGVSLQTAVRFQTPGIHWFEIHLDDVRLTKIPFRIIYMPQFRQQRRG